MKIFLIEYLLTSKIYAILSSISYGDSDKKDEAFLLGKKKGWVGLLGKSKVWVVQPQKTY